MTTGIVSWSVAQIFTKRIDQIGSEIQKGEHGVLVPTYARRWYVDGKVSSKECLLYPGYIFFETTKEWGEVSKIEGVIRVLGGGQRISDGDACRLGRGHATGEWNELAHIDMPKRGSRRRRRPRPGKRARSAVLSAAIGANP